MTPDEVRGRYLARRALIGLIWFLVEAIILAGVLRLDQQGDTGAAWGVGIFLILFCYMEGRVRK